MKLRHVLAAVVLVVPLLASCTQEGAEPLTVVAEDYGFSGIGGSIEGGVIDLTFQNDGEATHEFALISAENTSIDEFKKGFAPVFEGGPFPAFAKNGITIAETEPGETTRSELTVPAGEYVLFCALSDTPGESEKEGKPHYDLGMIQKITVEEGAEGDVSAAGGDFVAKDYGFETPDDLSPGEQTYVFRNSSSKEWHHMNLFEFEEGVTEDEAMGALKTSFSLEEGEDPPKGTPEATESGFTGVVGPGLAQTVELDLKPNRTYVAVCFVSDVKGGAPHAMAHNMLTPFTAEDA